jgi:FkbM family methyltransferase
MPNYKNHSFDDGIYIINLNDSYSIAMRDYGHSDILVYRQIFVKREYGIVFEILQQFGNQETIKIIDAGSNVGYTSVFFSRLSKNTKIVAIEPEPENIKILQKNIQINQLEGQVDVLPLALSSDSAKKFTNSRGFRDKLDWANVTIENVNGEIPAITVSEIMVMKTWDYIDFLKIDIEGHEKELFKSGSNYDFLKYTKIIAIEVHEDVMSKSEIELILKSENFLIFNSGELTIGLNRLVLFGL